MDGGKAPVIAIGVEVEEAFIHCAKALIRSVLWQPESWPQEVPSASAMLRDHIDLPDLAVETVEARLAESYEKTLP